MDRMAQHTKQPEVLRELFEALGNDPYVIAECLARPLLSERLVTNFYAHDERFHGQLRQRAQTESRRARTENPVPKVMVATSASYTLPNISDGANGCTDDTWTATDDVPPSGFAHTAVWTGSEMIVWGGTSDGIFGGPVNTGWRYNPSTDTWIATSTTNAPTARYVHTAVWTGSEMIVWGGGGNGYLNNSGSYYTSTASWSTTCTVNGPTARWGHTAVWTGSEMIVWGGNDGVNTLNKIGRAHV